MLRRLASLFYAARPGVLRLIFALCLIVVCFTLGWSSQSIIRLERAREDAAERARLERDFAIAATNADARLSHWLANENSRACADYLAFRADGRPNDALFAPPDNSPAAAPSPFLSRRQPLVRLHFMVSPAGLLTSPECPPEDCEDAIATAGVGSIANSPTALAALAAVRARHDEYDFRVVCSNAALREIRRQSSLGGGILPSDLPRAKANTPRAPVGRFISKVTSFYPAWVEGELYLLRNVATLHGDAVQGIWVNWPALRDALTEGVSGVFPGASFVACPPNTGMHTGAVALASLPEVALVSETLAVPEREPSRGLRLLLPLCWLFALFAFIGIGGMFWGVGTLSERRASFVSVVTHELRTPLTTFRLYTEMLDEDLVSDADRPKYIATLRSEADRLTHLVENVLGYARLEHGKALRRDDALTGDDLAGRIAPRMRERLAGAQMLFSEDVADDATDATALTDFTAVEQILFNLCDNAVKYAGGAGHAVKLSVNADKKFLRIIVADDGAGIPEDARRKLFTPFHRSTNEASVKKPGIGLGLAFSRQLARRLGGDLQLLPAMLPTERPTGATFLLTLPLRSGTGA